MSYRNETTPCDSNDYQLSLYDLTDDDAFTLDIVPCPNNNSTTDGGDESEAIGNASGGGGGESTTTNAGDDDTTQNDITVDSSQTSGGTVDLGDSNKNPNNIHSTGGSSNNENSNASQTVKDTGETANETSQSEQVVHMVETKESIFYTCHPDPTLLLEGILAPGDSGANKLEIAWDYEVLFTADSANGDAKSIKEGVSELEMSMTKDLARHYGLLDCASQRNRLLRNNNKSGHSASSGVVALDSAPVDQVLMGQSCSTAEEKDMICTPVRGYMTVWSDDESTDILTLIKTGMKNDSYKSDKVVKVVYIGIPAESDVKANAASTESQETADNSTTGATSGIFVPIGISIFVLAFIIIALFIVHRRRKANDERNGPKPLDPPNHHVLQTQTIDLEDDINLLPSPDKLDMRPIHETDSDSASGEHRSLRESMKEKESSFPRSVRSGDEDSLQDSVLSAGESVESGSAASGKSSSLAAMGAASTLTMRMAGSDNLA